MNTKQQTEYIVFEASAENCHYAGGGDKIKAVSLASAKRQASRLQMFQRTVLKILRKTDWGVEMVALKDCAGSWHDDCADGAIEAMWR